MITMITKRAVCGRKINYLVPGTIFLLFLFMWCLAPGDIYAQDQKIVATTNQQYHNLVRNASFESWSGGSSVIPDAWLSENTPSYLKLTRDKMIGSASLKVTATTTGQGLKQVVAVEPNTTYTASFYYKVDSGGSMTFNITGSQEFINQTGFNSTAWNCRNDIKG